MSLSKVLEVARGELGVKEAPAGSNRVKYWDDYDPAYQGQPWCVAFLWWVFNTAGERMAFFGGGKTASCGTLLRWYREQGLTVPEDQVQPGDIVILDFTGRKKDTAHCGIVTKTWWGPKGFDRFETIEGNTTNGAGQQDNGGVVAEKVRYPRNIVGVARPKYKPEKPEPVNDWENHHAKEHIKWGLDMGLIKGYTDGTVRPDEQVPLWRLMTILHRYHNLIRGEDDGK